MKMIRQYDHCIDREWMACLRMLRRHTQCVDVVGQKTAAPVEQVDGEEPASPGHEGAAIVGHDAQDWAARGRAAS